MAGKERVVVDLAKGFHEIGHRSVVCTTLREGELANELRNAEITCKCFRVGKSYNFLAIPSIVSYLRNNHIDVVVTHGTSGSWLARIAAILSRVPVFIHVEHTVSDEKPFYHIILNRLLAAFTDKIVCVSKNARQSLLRIERIKTDKVVFIHNGLHTGRFSYKQTQQKKNGDRKKVGIVGRFDKAKGHIYFVQAASRVVKSFKNVEFIFVGDGSLKTQVEQKVKELRLGEHCHFLGQHLEVGEIFQTLDVFVMSSIREGLPISLVEAQYFGVASVVTAVGGMPEIIKNNYNGLIVPPKDPEKLATAILSVLNDDELRDQLGVNAKKIFANSFSIANATQNYLKLISEILAQKDRNGSLTVKGVGLRNSRA